MRVEVITESSELKRIGLRIITYVPPVQNNDPCYLLQRTGGG